MGYINFSMSENALNAYINGEKPLSKWSKSDILEALPVDKREIAKRLRLCELKSRLLIETAWHHTSEYFNKTDFYEIDTEAVEELTTEKVEQIVSSRPKKAIHTSESVKNIKKCHFLTWSGSRKHPKAEEHIETCEICGNWAITSFGKKSIYANGFYFVK